MHNEASRSRKRDLTPFNKTLLPQNRQSTHVYTRIRELQHVRNVLDVPFFVWWDHLDTFGNPADVVFYLPYVYTRNNFMRHVFHMIEFSRQVKNVVNSFKNVDLLLMSLSNSPLRRQTPEMSSGNPQGYSNIGPLPQTIKSMFSMMRNRN